MNQEGFTKDKQFPSVKYKNWATGFRGNRSPEAILKTRQCFNEFKQNIKEKKSFVKIKIGKKKMLQN